MLPPRAATASWDPLPDLTIEPGRSIIAPAGVALYRVGSVKHGARTYVAVDGGMADNIRPTAYGAKYTAVLASRVSGDDATEVAVAGKYCETGDILIQRIALPLPRVGEVIAVPASGAYQLSMASNYTWRRAPRWSSSPMGTRAWCENGRATTTCSRGDGLSGAESPAPAHLVSAWQRVAGRSSPAVSLTAGRS